MGNRVTGMRVDTFIIMFATTLPHAFVYGGIAVEFDLDDWVVLSTSVVFWTALILTATGRDVCEYTIRPPTRCRSPPWRRVRR